MFLLDKNFLPTPVEGKVDPLSIDGLIAWLETQPGNEEYCFTEGTCLFGRYADHLGYGSGFPAQRKMFEDWNAAHGTSYSIEAWNLPFQKDGFCEVAQGNPRTMAGALTRAIEYRAAQRK